MGSLVSCSRDRMWKMWEEEKERNRSNQQKESNRTDVAGEGEESKREDTQEHESRRKAVVLNKRGKPKGPSHRPKQPKKPPPPPPAPLLTPNFDFMIADLVHLPYRSNLFDAVICIAVLHHLSTRERRIDVIKECL